MSLDLDDKILGEKVNNYISSSEDEGEDESSAPGAGEDDHPEYRYGGESRAAAAQVKSAPEIEPPPIDYSRTSATGPKGVIEDYRRYKQLQAERKAEQERELMALTKRLAMTCAPSDDPELALASANKPEDPDDPFMQEFNTIFEEYKMQRMQEMENLLESVPTFGTVYSLDCDTFISAVDNEHELVNVVILVHDPVNSKTCDAVLQSFKILAKEYLKVKFCAISAEEAGLSDKFRSEATPAILVYKNKQQIGTFVQLDRELSEEVFAVDVEAFLLEHAMLPGNESRLLKDGDDLD